MAELLITTGDGIACITQYNGRWFAKMCMQHSGAQCLTLDPCHPGALYAGSRSKGVWRSIDRGRSWQDMHLPQPDVFSLAVSPVDGTVYAGCEPSMLFCSTDHGETWNELAALRSIPSAPTWSFPPRPWTSHVR